MTGVGDEHAAISALAEIARGQRVNDAAKALLRSLPEGEVGLDLGLRLQLGVLQTWRAAGETVGGWKIGLTTRTARDSMGSGFRPFGFILSSRIYASGDTLALGLVGPNPSVEIEIALTMGSDLAGPDVTPEQARAAVAAMSPAFELVSRRTPSGIGVAARLGNDLGNWGMVIGPAGNPDTPLAELEVAFSRRNEVIGRSGTGPDVLDDPFVSLSRVARTLDRYGLGLRAGQHVITGSLLPPCPVDSPGLFTGDLGALGTVTIAFAQGRTVHPR